MQGSVTGNKSVDKQQAGSKFVALVQAGSLQLVQSSAVVLQDVTCSWELAIQIGAACRSDDAAE